MEVGGRQGRGRKGFGRFGRGAGGSEEVRKAVGKCGRGGKGTGSNGTLQGRGIPKLVSLFEPVKRVVQLADKHKLWEAGQLPDEEFSGLDEFEIERLERR